MREISPDNGQMICWPVRFARRVQISAVLHHSTCFDPVRSLERAAKFDTERFDTADCDDQRGQSWWGPLAAVNTVCQRAARDRF